MLYSSLSYSQEDKVTQAQQIAISSMSLVDALASRYPGARKYIDRMGNNNIALRGRQSFKTAGNQVLWEIDGVLYNNPPSLYANQVKYVEILNSLAATNRYGSEGAGGVVVVKTNVSAEKFNSRKNLWNKSLQIPNKKKDKKAKKKKKDKKS
jgi:hypothetical protein